VHNAKIRHAARFGKNCFCSGANARHFAPRRVGVNDDFSWLWTYAREGMTLLARRLRDNPTGTSIQL